MARNAERRTQEYFETLQQGAIATQTSLQQAVAVSVGAIQTLMERDPRTRSSEVRRIESGSSWVKALRLVAERALVLEYLSQYDK